MNKNLQASNVCILCYHDPTNDGEQPDNPEILVCDTPYEDINYVQNAGHGMCSNCYETARFRHGMGTCPMCRLPWTNNIADYPPRLRDRIDGGDHVVTAENILNQIQKRPPDLALAEHLIDLIQPGFDFHVSGQGFSLFYYVIMEKNPDILDKLLRKAVDTNNAHLFLEANIHSPQFEEAGYVFTALQWACKSGWSYAIAELARYHADPNYYLGLCPALHIALQNQHEGAAEAVLVAGARVDMVDKYGLGPLFYFSPGILKNASLQFLESPDDGDIDQEREKQMARERTRKEMTSQVNQSLKVLDLMCRQGADVNQFGVFPHKYAHERMNERLEKWVGEATTVTPLFTILVNQHDVYGHDSNARYMKDDPELQLECWEAVAQWMVEVTKIFARSGCDIYGRIHGGETLLYWVQRWSDESETMPCKMAYAKLLRHLRIQRWIPMRPLQPR